MQVPMNGSTVLGLGRRLSAQLHTTAVTNGTSSAELLLAAGLLERLTDFANGSHEVRNKGPRPSGVWKLK